MPPPDAHAPGVAPSPGAIRPVAARLRDGRKVRLRPAGPADLPRVAQFLGHVSRESLELRFFWTVPIDTVAAGIVAPRVAGEAVSLLLEFSDPADGAIVAHGEYARGTGDPSRAEVAFLVSQEWQGRGAATLLLLRLAEIAAASGIQQLEAVVRAENQPMIDVFLDAGYPCSITWHEGEGLVLLDIGHEPQPRRHPRGASRDYPLVPA